jgi:hypothetical protein
MKEYHKIQTVFKRDPETNHKKLLFGDYSLPEFEYLKDNQWIFTEKVDGTNIRVMFDGKGLSFGGKTDGAQIPALLVKKLNDRFLPQLPLFFQKFGNESEVCLYGEGYGAKIQKGGGNYRQDQDFVLFDVNIRAKQSTEDNERVNDWWLQRVDVEDVARFFVLDVVPIIGEGTFDEMIQMAKNGFVSTWGSFQAEGIVARPKTELRTRSGARLITKIKHRDF